MLRSMYLLGPSFFLLACDPPLAARARLGELSATFVDVDGDGDLDRLDLDVDELVVGENRGDTTVERRYRASTSGEDEYTALEVVDLDGDGALDVLAVGENNLSGRDCALVRWDNDGQGGFVWSRISAGVYGWSCEDLALGDLDGDGAPEVVAAELLDGAVHVFQRAGTSFAEVALPGFDPSCPDFTRSLDLGDLDGDGRAELLCGAGAPLAASLVLAVVRHDAPRDLLVASAAPGHLVAAAGPARLVDADGDGDRDVRLDVVDELGNHARLWSENDGAGGLAPLRAF